MRTDRYKEATKRREGIHLKPYTDTTGNITIGYGHNLNNGIDKDILELMFERDFNKAEEVVCKLFGANLFALNDNRYFVLVDMAFNLGEGGLSSFKNMISYINEGRFEDAASEMLQSKWAVQVGTRAIELSGIMKRG